MTTMVKLWSDVPLDAGGPNEHWVDTAIVDEVLLIGTPMATDYAAEVRVVLASGHYRETVTAQFADLAAAEQYRSWLILAKCGVSPDELEAVDMRSTHVVVGGGPYDL